MRQNINYNDEEVITVKDYCLNCLFFNDMQCLLRYPTISEVNLGGWCITHQEVDLQKRMIEIGERIRTI